MDRTSKGFKSAVAIEHKVFGVAFLAMLLFFGWLTYAVFSKKFTDYVEVDLLSSKTGLQLPDNADVKVRGVIVGAVRDREATADGARLTLGIYPRHLEKIPADTTARIVPKTLFGEKYVALQIPSDASAESISAGDVIAQSDVAIEVERVLSDLYPLLRAVQPVDLNYTLTALATALEGRGESIGNNLVVLNDYLERTNPQIPELVEDLRLLSEVSDNYAQVMPELARLLRNSVTTGNTFVEKEQKIEAFFNDVAGFSTTSRDFLQRNGENIIRLGELSVPQLNLYAKYAPEYPCLLEGIVRAIPRQAQTFRGHTLHINLEVLPRQPRGFTAADDAVYGDQRGPHDTDLCRRAINGEWHQGNLPPDSLVPNIVDGVDEPVGKGESPNRAAPGPAVDMTSGYAGTRAEQGVVDAVTAPVLDVPVGEVPDLATLLFGPIARGTEVSLR